LAREVSRLIDTAARNPHLRGFEARVGEQILQALKRSKEVIEVTVLIGPIMAYPKVEGGWAACGVDIHLDAANRWSNLAYEGLLDREQGKGPKVVRRLIFSSID
jgi:hypothetical protein